MKLRNEKGLKSKNKELPQTPPSSSQESKREARMSTRRIAGEKKISPDNGKSNGGEGVIQVSARPSGPWGRLAKTLLRINTRAKKQMSKEVSKESGLPRHSDRNRANWVIEGRASVDQMRLRGKNPTWRVLV